MIPQINEVGAQPVHTHQYGELSHLPCLAGNMDRSKVHGQVLSLGTDGKPALIEGHC